MKYDAFISYRHVKPDIDIAKKLHSALENYPVPHSVRKKTGKKKIRRVFRDQEELPIGSDLNDNISRALQDSEYLIVVCSTNTPGSYWVCKEIETFIQMHDRHHVLAVLVEGEPNESFPPMLLTDENGNQVEPLAADIRGSNQKEVRKKFKTEIIRLAASVLGCNYDDLRQRHRERIIKRNIAVAAVCAVIIGGAGTAFGIYNAKVAERTRKLADEKAALADEKTQLANDKSRLADEKEKLADDVMQQYEAKLENQSRFYAEEAMNLLSQGNREDAVLVAFSGINTDENERPYVADAEYALAASLYAYANGESLEFDRLLNHDMVVRSTILSEDESRLLTVDSGNNVCVWDTKSWELLAKISANVNDSNYRKNVKDAYADQFGIYILTSDDFTKYDYKGDPIFTYVTDKEITDTVFDGKNNIAFCLTSSDVKFVSMEDGSEIAVVAKKEPDDTSAETGMDKEGKYLVYSYNIMDSVEGYMSVINIEKRSVSELKLSQPHILSSCFTQDGNIAVLSCNSDFYYEGLSKIVIELFDPESGERLWSAEPGINIRDVSGFTSLLGGQSFGDGEKKHSYIVLAADEECLVIDEADGKTLKTIMLAGSAVTMDLNEDSSVGFIGYTDGNIDAFDFFEGRIYNNSRVETGVALRQMVVLSGQVVLRVAQSDSLYVMKYHEASDLKELDPLESSCYGLGVSQDSQYYVLSDSMAMYKYYFYSPEGKHLYTCDKSDEIVFYTGFFDNRFLLLGRDGIYLVDPINESEELITYADMGVSGSYVSARLCGKYMALWSFANIVVIDLEDRKCVYTNTFESSVGNCVISDDGSKLYLTRTGAALTEIDIASGKEKQFDNLLSNVSDCDNINYIAVSPSGKYVAMACMDGNLRLVDTSSGDFVAEYVFYAESKCFIRFSSDEKYLFMQGDDYRLHIINIVDNCYSYVTQTAAEIKYIIEDDANSNIAVCDNFNVYLFDKEDVGLKAYVPNAVTYLSSDCSFILLGSSRVCKTGYKNLDLLIEEAHRQFPDLVLTEEKAVKYNIN